MLIMGNIRTWKKNLRYAIDYWFDSDIDSDHPKCPYCSSVMNFYGHDDNGDFPEGEGYWECSGCGFKITEKEVK